MYFNGQTFGAKSSVCEGILDDEMMSPPLAWELKGVENDEKMIVCIYKNQCFMNNYRWVKSRNI